MPVTAQKPLLAIGYVIVMDAGKRGEVEAITRDSVLIRLTQGARVGALISMPFKHIEEAFGL